MEDNYKFAALMHWIAASSSAVPDGTGSRTPRNDGGGANNRHCEGALRPRQSSAFSLIELLISLIVISLIISAFIPILSNRLKHREVALGGSKIETKCSEKFNEKCMMCNDASCILCTNSFSCPYGQYCDAEDDCKCKSCSAIEANCLGCNNGACLKCDIGYALKEGKCKKQTAICEVTFNGVDYAIKGAVKVTSGDKSYCFMATNAGDGAWAHVLTNAGITPTTGINCPNTKCCWRHNKTGGNSTQTPLNTLIPFTYSPQGRTVCNGAAAKVLCQAAVSPIAGKSWHLPSIDEFNILASAINSEINDCTLDEAQNNKVQKCIGEAGLQLCDGAIGYGSPYSSFDGYYCNSIYSYECIVSGLWSSNYSPNDHRGARLDYGSIGFFNDLNYDIQAYGRSVRCVLGPL